MDESERATGLGAGGAGRKRLPPGPGQLDLSQPSDSVPLSSQAARQEGEGVAPPRGCPGPVLESSLADHKDCIYMADALGDVGDPRRQRQV